MKKFKNELKKEKIDIHDDLAIFLTKINEMVEKHK